MEFLKIAGEFMDWQLFDEQWRKRYETATLQALTELFQDAAPDTAEEEFQ